MGNEVIMLRVGKPINFEVSVNKGSGGKSNQIADCHLIKNYTLIVERTL